MSCLSSYSSFLSLLFINYVTLPVFIAATVANTRNKCIQCTRYDSLLTGLLHVAVKRRQVTT